ncbi:cache domain-containing sensor histidine kinase [Paenibacillus puerhi]|uniref:cache domain-containing sensor histidine kinase n=1 Tax=Paenibacillus puerhi TaxID=2692622 RepID=UPI00135BBCFD|nr:sensor histidine kinase [Paenibacillus puerhi]
MKIITLLTNNIHIRKKLMLSYVLIVLVPVLIVGMLLTQSLQRMAVDHAVQQSVNNVEKIKKQVEETLKIPADISNKIYFDKRLKELLGRNFDSSLEVYQAYASHADLAEYRELYKEVAGVRLYTWNRTLLENWVFFQLKAKVSEQAWYKEALSNRGKVGWYRIPDETREDQPLVSLARPIFFSNMSFAGMLVIAVSPQTLQSIVHQEPYETMIVSEQDVVLAAKNPGLVGHALPELQVAGPVVNPGIQVMDARHENKPVKLIVQSIQPENSVNGLQVVSIIPLEAILKESRSISLIAYGMIACTLLLALVIIVFFSNAFTKRIRLLIKDIRLVSRGDLSHHSSIQGRDEVGQLSWHFNSMVSSIKELMIRVEEEQQRRHELEIRQKEIQFKMLVNQVNPHFLFNVLESIRMKALYQEEDEIADSVHALGKLLRHNLELGHKAVPLQAELETVRAYLDIQKFRFGDKLTFRLPEPSVCQGILILPMLVQPLVENAIIHGIESGRGKGTVGIDVIRGTEATVITVEDNGIGLEAGRLRTIAEGLDEPEKEQGQRIGLRNVHQRIKLYYGPGYGLELVSVPGQGTKVSIVLPADGRKGGMTA